jgi:hypothetical protein
MYVYVWPLTHVLSTHLYVCLGEKWHLASELDQVRAQKDDGGALERALGRFEPELVADDCQWNVRADAQKRPGPSTRFDVDPNESVMCKEDREKLPVDARRKLQELADAQARSPASVVGRLREHIDYWREIARDDRYVLDMVENGYTVRLAAPVVPRRFKNHPGCSETPEHTAFVRKAVADMLLVGAARVVDPSYPEVISPLNAVYKKGNKKFRLIMDMRWFNVFVWYESFRFELQKREGREVCLPMWFLALLDLAAAYYHVFIREEDQKYFGVELDGVVMVMCVLPFGFVDAPRAFTRLLRPQLAHFRMQGIRIMGYLDDFLWGGCSFTDSLHESDDVGPSWVCASRMVDCMA